MPLSGGRRRGSVNASRKAVAEEKPDEHFWKFRSAKL
jgi:hypothetical protein